MATRHAVVRHAEGLHARPAEMIAREAIRHVAQVTLVHGSRRVDAKSILDVLTLGAVQGAELIVEAAGDDEEAAAQSVATLIESDFVSHNNTTEGG